MRLPPARKRSPPSPKGTFGSIRSPATSSCPDSMRRYAAEATAAGYVACAAAAWTPRRRSSASPCSSRSTAGWPIARQSRGEPPARCSPKWPRAANKRYAATSPPLRCRRNCWPTSIAIGTTTRPTWRSCDSPPAWARARPQRRAQALAADASLAPADRIAAIGVLGEVGTAACVPALWRWWAAPNLSPFNSPRATRWRDSMTCKSPRCS